MAQCKSYPILPNILATLKSNSTQPQTGYRYSSYQVDFKIPFLNEINPNLDKPVARINRQQEVLLKPPNVNEDNLDALILVLTTAHCPTLTKREIEITSFWLSGYSIKESARVFNIAQRTVEEYRARAKEKLKVKDKKALYELASSQGSLEIYFRIAKILKSS